MNTIVLLSLYHLHTNEDIAEKSIFGGLIASSLHTLAACARCVVEAQGHIPYLKSSHMALKERWINAICY